MVVELYDCFWVVSLWAGYRFVLVSFCVYSGEEIGRQSCYFVVFFLCLEFTCRAKFRGLLAGEFLLIFSVMTELDVPIYGICLTFVAYDGGYQFFLSTRGASDDIDR